MRIATRVDEDVYCRLCGREFESMDRLVDHLSHKGVFDRINAITGGGCDV